MVSAFGLVVRGVFPQVYTLLDPGFSDQPN